MRTIAWFALVLAGVLPLAPAAARAADVDLSTPEAVRKALAHREPGVRLAAAQVAAAMQDAALTAPLVRSLRDDVLEVRQAAARALAARTDPKERKAAARSVAALLRPLLREPAPDDLAREALLVPLLHDLAQTDSVKALLDVHTEAPIEEIRARLFAVANVPAPEAIEALIDYGARRRGGDGHRSACQAALRYATGVSLPADPDRWREWWREWKDRFDFPAAAERRAAERQKQDAARERREKRKEKQGEGDGEAPEGATPGS